MKQIFNIPEGCSKVSIEQIGNKIVTEFESEIKFKAGDIIFKDGRIMIYKLYRDSVSFYIYSLIWYPFGKEVSYGGYYGHSIDGCRMAADKEKQLLFDALAKTGKKWNAETLQIEDLKVEPKVGDCVKYIDDETGNYGFAVIETDGCRLRPVGEYIGCDCKEKCNKTAGLFCTDSTYTILTPDQFQSELSQLGFVYNFEDDTISEKKWVPKEMEICYIISTSRGGFESLEFRYSSENYKVRAFKDGRIFKTKSECESAIEKIKLILKTK